MRVATPGLVMILLLAMAPQGAGAAETVWLGSLDLSKMQQGFGKPQVDHAIADKPVSDKPLKLAGRQFAHGVGTHARSVVWIDLAGGSDRFLATVGVDDAAGRPNGTTFKIVGDGKVLFKSGVMNPGQRPETVDIDLTGVQRLVLICGAAGGSIDFAHGDWADARFLVSGAKPQTIDAPGAKAVILTPPPPLAPRINGAKIFGVRPGSPFFFTIPATGQRPMTFAAEGLPAGLSLDPQTGHITGTLSQRGEYGVFFQATNALGTARRGFKIICGDTLALTPEMGWNSWYKWINNVNDKIIRDAADAMVSNGMINHGYIYVNIDDCWAYQPGSKDPVFGGPIRDAAGKVNSNRRFPDMKALTDFIHRRGLRAGIYTSPGPTTCAGCTGAYRHEAEDAQRFAEWGFDFLKYDWCSCGAPLPGLAGRQEPYRKMSALLKKQPRDILLNFCQYGNADVWKWGRECGGNSWRTADDLGRGYLTGEFDLMCREVFDLYADQKLHKYAGPGAWNDPDYLQMGQLSYGPTTLSPDAQYSQFSLWSLVAAPLIFGGDVKDVDDFTLSLVSNDEVIEVDQDALGKAGRRVAKNGDQEVWARPLEDGSLAVGLFNRSEMETTVTANWSDLGVQGKQRLRDLWRQKELGTLEGRFSSLVPAQGVVLIRLWSAEK